MDNLINFEENDSKTDSQKPSRKSPEKPLFINDRLSIELNNPFDKLEYKVTHSGDPFECLEINKEMRSSKTFKESDNCDKNSDILESIFGKMNTKCDFLNSTDPSPTTSLTSSYISQNDSDISTSSKNKTLKRCQSDSSTDGKSTDAVTSKFSSLDNILSTKTNQLLKLSLMNSPNSPLHSSSRTALDGSLIDSVCFESKMLSNKLTSLNNEMSFEDLNNISQHLIDTSNISFTDGDLTEMKISFLDHNSDSSKSIKNSARTTEDIQDILKQIKKEYSDEAKKSDVIEIKDIKKEPASPVSDSSQKSDHDVDDILQKLKSLMKDNNKLEAKKQLQKLNDLLGPSEPKLLQVQPMIRQDTFEIDQNTGKRKYLSHNGAGDNNDVNTNGELMEKLAQLFGAQSLDVGSLNLSNGSNSETKVVVILPTIQTPAATPVKQKNPSRRSVSFSSQRPSTAVKGIENKKLSTPMKPSTGLTSNTVRRSSFTAPRPVGKHPYDQKLNIGTVRKSLMGSMDKSPLKSNAKNISPNNKNMQVRPSSNVRRSVSLKGNIPALKISEPSPIKSRPATTSSTRLPASSVSRLSMSNNRRLSTLPPRPASEQRASLGVNTRPGSKKTEFKAPLPSSKISSSKESMV